jgi:hypothetical protein
MNEGRCEFTKPGGVPCQARALPGERFCYFHHPDREESRQDARRRGAQTRNRKPDHGPVEELPLGTVREVVAMLGRTINDVRCGRCEAKVGNAVACLTGQLLAALRGADFEERLAAMERRLAEGGTCDARNGVPAAGAPGPAGAGAAAAGDGGGTGTPPVDALPEQSAGNSVQ